MTMLGQSPRYWAGDYHDVIEFNLLARPLLRLHPAVFPLAGCASCVLVAIGLFWLNLRLAQVFAFVVTFCHAVAAAAWMARLGSVGIIAAIATLVLMERLLSFAWQRVGESDPPVAEVAKVA